MGYETGEAFANISNHPSNKWSEEQISAAEMMSHDGTTCGMIDDYSFPNVPPTATTEEVQDLAGEFLQKNPKLLLSSFAMVQGEFTLTQALVKRLQAEGVKCVAACSRREVIENQDGTKTVKFSFVQFREYEGNPQ